MPTSNTRSDDSFCDACRDGTFDDGCHRVHGSHNLGLELWWNVEFDLLKKVLGGAETADDENILDEQSISCFHMALLRAQR